MTEWKDRSDSTGIVVAVVVILVLATAGGLFFAYERSSAAERARDMARHQELRARVEAERARGFAESAARLAETEAERSAALTEFVVELLRDADPGVGPKPDISVRDVLDAAEHEARQPEHDADMRKALETVIRRARAKLEERK